MQIISRTNVASVGSVFNDTRKVKVLSLPQTISFQVVREPLPFAYANNTTCDITLHNDF